MFKVRLVAIDMLNCQLSKGFRFCQRDLKASVDSYFSITWLVQVLV